MSGSRIRVFHESAGIGKGKRERERGNAKKTALLDGNRDLAIVYSRENVRVTRAAHRFVPFRGDPVLAAIKAAGAPSVFARTRNREFPRGRPNEVAEFSPIATRRASHARHDACKRDGERRRWRRRRRRRRRQRRRRRWTREEDLDPRRQVSDAGAPRQGKLRARRRGHPHRPRSQGECDKLESPPGASGGPEPRVNPSPRAPASPARKWRTLSVRARSPCERRKLLPSRDRHKSLIPTRNVTRS